MDKSVHSVEYWKRLSERYRHQRDMAVREIKCLQKELYIATGCARDGHDYLRQIRSTLTTPPSLAQRLKKMLRVSQ